MFQKNREILTGQDPTGQEPLAAENDRLNVFAVEGQPPTMFYEFVSQCRLRVCCGCTARVFVAQCVVGVLLVLYLPFLTGIGKF